MTSIPKPGGCSLRLVKNRREFDKVVDQNFPLFFTGNYTLNKIFSLEGKEAQNGGGKHESEIWGEPPPKTSGSCARF